MSESLESQNLSEILSTAHRAADQASQILLSYFDNLAWVGEKEQAGLVTEADQKSEETIRNIIAENHPDHSFLGEETGHHTGRKQDGPFLWIVDPLDGTTNFVHSFPLFCISIGVEYEGELVVALIDAPLLRMRWTAIKGEGTKLNGKKVQVSQREGLGKTLFATGFASQKKVEIDKQLEHLGEILQKTRGIRRGGAAALDLCFVAQGVFDGFWESNLSPWDTAAGALLVREAGGIVQSFDNPDYDPRMKSIIAGSPNSLPLLRDILKLPKL